MSNSSMRTRFAMIGCTLFALVLTAACGASEQAAAGASSVAAGDTPIPADGQCDFANFHHDESRNGRGAGSCAGDCDCDGMRSCVSGTCQGTARPAVLTAAACNSKDYHFNESWSPSGPGTCSGDCECDGLRTCVSGRCSGTAR